jgi:hypothetical protein
MKTKYEYLEQLFRNEAEKEGSVYVPNIWPDKPVDYVFIAMEPSLGNWANNNAEAQLKVIQGFKNIASSTLDFIVHHCVREYFLPSGKTYCLTDLSKGAMLVKEAKKDKKARYKRWHNLLIDELAIVSKETTKRIAIGGIVRDTLKNTDLKCHFDIAHYSTEARGKHSSYISQNGLGSEYEQFERDISIDSIIKTAIIVLAEAKTQSQIADQIFEKVKSRGLSKLEMRSFFYYKKELSRLSIDQ